MRQPGPGDYRSFLEAVEALSQGDREELLRQALPRDFWLFCVFSSLGSFRISDSGHPDEGGLWVMTKEIFWFCRYLQFLVETYPDGLHGIGLPRFHLKSTITRLFVCWLLARDPNETVGIISHARDLAEEMRRGIENEIQKGPLAFLFPAVDYSSAGKGLGLVRDIGATEPSVGSYNLYHLPTGRHFSKIVYDDMVHDSDGQPALEQYRRTVPLGQDRTFRLALFTRYGQSDVYGLLMKQKAFRTCVILSCQEYQLRGREFLAQWRRDLGPVNAALQLDLNAEIGALVNPLSKDLFEGLLVESLQLIESQWTEEFAAIDGSTDGECMTVLMTFRRARLFDRVMVTGIYVSERSIYDFMHDEGAQILTGRVSHVFTESISGEAHALARMLPQINFIPMKPQLSKLTRLNQILIPQLHAQRVFFDARLSLTRGWARLVAEGEGYDHLAVRAKDAFNGGADALDALYWVVVNRHACLQYDRGLGSMMTVHSESASRDPFGGMDPSVLGV